MGAEKDVVLGVKMDAETNSAIRRIAAAKKCEAAELMRRAAAAIIAYAEAFGDKAVPLDMAIRQNREVNEAELEEALASIAEARKRKRP